MDIIAPELETPPNPTDIIHPRIAGNLLLGVNSERATRLKHATVAYGGHVFDADKATIDNVSSLLTADMAGVPVQWPVSWRDSDNNMVDLSRVDLIALAGLMLAKVNSIYISSFQLKDEIIPLLTYGDVPAFSVSANSHWPQ